MNRMNPVLLSVGLLTAGVALYLHLTRQPEDHCGACEHWHADGPQGPLGRSDIPGPGRDHRGHMIFCPTQPWGLFDDAAAATYWRVA